MKTFTDTSDKPYDRHYYTVHYPNGSYYTYQTYEEVRLHYFNALDKNCTVTVCDNNVTQLRSSPPQGF